MLRDVKHIHKQKPTLYFQYTFLFVILFIYISIDFDIYSYITICFHFFSNISIYFHIFSYFYIFHSCLCFPFFHIYIYIYWLVFDWFTIDVYWFLIFLFFTILTKSTLTIFSFTTRSLFLEIQLLCCSCRFIVLLYATGGAVKVHSDVRFRCGLTASAQIQQDVFSPSKAVLTNVLLWADVSCPSWTFQLGLTSTSYLSTSR